MSELLKYTERFLIGTATYCPNSIEHRDCPMHLFQHEPKMLPEQIVYDIIHFMAEEKFEGRLSFFNYGEPFVDPRMMGFIREARCALPKVWIYQMSMGWNMNQTLVDDLRMAGLDELELTAYSDKEDERFQKLKGNGLRIRVERRRGLDNRMEIYDMPHKTHIQPCYSPLGLLTVFASGKVALCCRDWKEKVTYGNLNFSSIRTVLERGEMLKAYKELAKGKRTLDICRRCKWTHGNLPKGMTNEDI